MPEIRKDLQACDRAVDELTAAAQGKNMAGMILLAERMESGAGIAMAAQGFFPQGMTSQMRFSVIRACLNYAMELANDELSKSHGDLSLQEVVPHVKVDSNAN